MNSPCLCATCREVAYLYSFCPSCKRTICYDCSGGRMLTKGQACNICIVPGSIAPRDFNLRDCTFIDPESKKRPQDFEHYGYGRTD